MFEEIPLGALIGALALFILLSALFSGSETGLFSLNRYRLKHLALHHSGAARAQELLSRPDRLIGILLLGNTFVNIAASSLATVIALRLWGDAGVAIAAGVLTLLLLIFGEVTPKTIAALYPERVAFAASHVLWVLLRLLHPLVRAINAVTNGLLGLFGISADKAPHHALSSEELRTVVHEAGAVISAPHQRMLLSILDLEKATVEEIMVPRSDIVGIDLEEPWEEIEAQLVATRHTWLPVWKGDIDHVVGFVHMRHFLALQGHGNPDKEEFRTIIREAYFIPEGTRLHTQLLNFQQQRRRIGLVVNEYGDILGLVTLEDILEEIVGEFTTDPAQNLREVHPQPDGTFLVDCTITIRELNRAMGWQLPTEGPRTLNGMITEYLETLPDPGTSFLLAGHPIEVVQTGGNAVKTVRINPAYRAEGNARRQRLGGM